MNAPANPARATDAKGIAARKFTYASGSRPLEGYTIKRGVGHGGFGEVYFAVSDAGKEVALKLIRRNLDVELRGVRQCLNLKHPNLLSIHDIRTDGQDDRWVVMEYISGESLEDVIERNPNGMPPEEVLRWMHGIAAGVAYLHEHGVVHRDLKPGNLFMDEGVVKLGDYGLAKFVSCSRRSGQTESVGTVHYMAPEISNGRYGKEIDTYALGVLLHEMLTGRVPFEGESVGEVLMKHLTAQPDLSLLGPPYRAIVARSLEKDPAARISSAQQLRELLPPLPSGTVPPHLAAHVGAAGAGSGAPHGASHAAEELVTANVVEEYDDGEEPIWRMIRNACRQLNEQWNAANIHPLVKAAVLLGAAFLLLTSAGLWFPALFFGVFLYGAYRVLWAITRPYPNMPPQGQPSRAAPPLHAELQAAASQQPPVQPSAAQPIAAQPASAHRPAPPRHDSRGSRGFAWHPRPKRTLPPKSAPEKVGELCGSLLLAPLVAVAMTVVMMVVRRDAMLPQQFAWLALVGTLASWTVMLPAKLWEGRAGEQAPRRFTMLVLGLALGGAAWGLAQWLYVPLPSEVVAAVSPIRTHEAFYAADGAPRPFAYLAYFGFLMLLLRWWRQADPLRGARLSLWSTACAVFGAWLLNFFWPFPQPWGFMLAAIVTVSVQLASPWQPSEELLADR